MSVARDIAAWLNGTLTKKGPVELATQTEVDTGTDTARVITPATLTASSVNSGRLIDVEVFTSSGTWTKPTGTKMIRVTVIGGGGGGGGCGGIVAGTQAGGGGGGGGAAVGYLDGSDVKSSHTVTVGSYGAKGVGASDGGTGGSSFFKDGATGLLEASGGAGGFAGNPNAGGGGSGGSGAVDAAVFDAIIFDGATGEGGIAHSNTAYDVMRGGGGGWSLFAAAGTMFANYTSAGETYGHGSGAHIRDYNGMRDGANGHAGKVIVESFS